MYCHSSGICYHEDQFWKNKFNKYPDVDVFHSRVMMIDELGQPIRTLQEREEYESALSLLRRRLEGTYQFIGDLMSLM